MFKKFSYLLRRIKFQFRFYLFKFIIIVLSLIIIAIILYCFIIIYIDSYRSKQIPIISLFVIFFLITIIILITFIDVISLNEFRSIITKRNFVKTGKSYLTIEDIFENEIREKILNKLLQNPGIHFNELLRQCDLHRGQLQWHLDVLLEYNIIKKENFGQYTLYFPKISSYEELKNYKNGLAKSNTSLKILKLIKDNPGIYISEISQDLDLTRNTVKYHIDKLCNKNLISIERKNRRILLYATIDNSPN